MLSDPKKHSKNLSRVARCLLKSYWNIVQGHDNISQDQNYSSLPTLACLPHFYYFILKNFFFVRIAKNLFKGFHFNLKALDKVLLKSTFFGSLFKTRIRESERGKGKEGRDRDKKKKRKRKFPTE